MIFQDVTRLDLFKSHFLKALNIPFKKVVLPGRVKCGGTEGEIVVAHGRLPSPARSASSKQNKKIEKKLTRYFSAI